jgi:hypothetical protein
VLSLISNLALSHFISAASTAKFDCIDIPLKPVLEFTSALSPTGDFAERDKLPRTEKATSDWKSCCGSYGPCALPYPRVEFPKGSDILSWSRLRVIEAAKKFIGVPYAHHHIPELGGLDCSNFTALVFNYAFGTRFSSHVVRQASEAGRLLATTEPLIAGDLIFIYSKDLGKREIAHVAIYIDENNVIDSTDDGVKIRPYAGWYKERFARARRVLE